MKEERVVWFPFVHKCDHIIDYGMTVSAETEHFEDLTPFGMLLGQTIAPFLEYPCPWCGGETGVDKRPRTRTPTKITWGPSLTPFWYRYQPNLDRGEARANTQQARRDFAALARFRS